MVNNVCRVQGDLQFFLGGMGARRCQHRLFLALATSTGKQGALRPKAFVGGRAQSKAPQSRACLINPRTARVCRHAASPVFYFDVLCIYLQELGPS